jgi:hypothetical protein
MYTIRLNSEVGEYDSSDYNTIDIQSKVTEPKGGGLAKTKVDLTKTFQQFVDSIGLPLTVNLTENK